LFFKFPILVSCSTCWWSFETT